jgi:hypothetical protein
VSLAERATSAARSIHSEQRGKGDVANIDRVKGAETANPLNLSYSNFLI